MPSIHTMSPPHSHLSTLRITDYHPCYHDQVVTVFTTGLQHNKTVSTCPLVQADLDHFLSYAVDEFHDVDSIVYTSNGGRLFLAVTPDDTVAGMVGLKRSDDDIATNTSELVRVSVASAWQRQGLASMLMDHAIRYGMDRFSIGSVYLKTLDNMGHVPAMYKRMGFKMELRDMSDIGFLTRLAFFSKELPCKQDERMKNVTCLKSESYPMPKSSQSPETTDVSNNSDESDCTLSP